MSFVDELYQSVASSTSTAQVRKQRQPSGTFTGLEGGRPINTETVALKHLHDHYDGKRKPALVLQFQNGSEDGHFYVRLGEAELHVGHWDQAGFVAQLRVKVWRWSRKHKDFRKRMVVIMRGRVSSSAYGAARNLLCRPGWFYYQGEWKSAEWVYKSLVLIGLSFSDPKMPQNYVVGMKQDNLHVSGTWLWDIDKLPEVRVPVNTPFPSIKGKSRTPVPPDKRTSEAYIQDAEKLGTMPHSTRVVNDKGLYIRLPKKIVKAPIELPYNNKRPNPNKVVGLRPNQHSASESIEQYTPLTEWVKGE